MEKCNTVNKRRSSLFVENNDDIGLKNCNYPEDYADKLETECNLWCQTVSDLKKEIDNLHKCLRQNSKFPIDMSILDKTDQQFFDNVPTLYDKYISTLEGLTNQVQVASMISDNNLKQKQKLKEMLEEKLNIEDEKIKEKLKKIHHIN